MTALSISVANREAFARLSELTIDPKYHWPETSRAQWVTKGRGSGLQYWWADRWFSVHSLYNPEAECVRLVGGLGPKALFVVYGLGTFDYLDALASRFPESTILVFEPIPETIPLVLANRSVPKSLVESGRVKICLFAEADFQTTLEHFYEPSIHLSVEILALSTTATCTPNEYARFQHLSQKVLDRRFHDYRIQAFFGSRWLFALGHNLRALVSNPDRFRSLDRLPPRRTDTALVLGAGPSAEYLSQLQPMIGRGSALFCSDTSWQLSTSQGLVPDFVASIDAQVHSSHHLMGLRNRQSHGLFDFCALPLLVRSTPVTSLVNTGHPLLEALRFLGAALNEPIPTGGNVGSWLVYLAFALGYPRVFCLGLDFSYGYRRPYARPSFLFNHFNATSNRLHGAENHFQNLYIDEKLIRTEWGYQIARLIDYEEHFQANFPHQAVKTDPLETYIYREITNPHPVGLASPPFELEGLRTALLALRERLNDLGNRNDFDSLKFAPPADQVCFAAAIPLLAHKQLITLKKGLNPADTLRNDARQAAKQIVTTIDFILGGSP